MYKRTYAHMAYLLSRNHSDCLCPPFLLPLCLSVLILSLFFLWLCLSICLCLCLSLFYVGNFINVSSRFCFCNTGLSESPLRSESALVYWCMDTQKNHYCVNIWTIPHRHLQASKILLLTFNIRANPNLIFVNVLEMMPSGCTLSLALQGEKCVPTVLRQYTWNPMCLMTSPLFFSQACKIKYCRIISECWSLFPS